MHGTMHGAGDRSRGQAAPAVLLAALAGVLLGASPAEAQFSAQPVILNFSAGSSDTRPVTLKNRGGDPIQLRFYGADFDRDEDGSHRFMELGEHPSSCGDRLRVFPDGVRLQPEDSVSLRVEMDPGGETCWSVVFAETVRSGEGGIRIGQRIGIKVFAVRQRARVDAEVRDVAVARRGDSTRVSFVFRNTGERPLRPRGRLEIRRLDGTVVTTRRLGSFGTLPDRSRRVKVDFGQRLEPGRYLAVPLFDIGTDYLVGGQARFRVAEGSRVTDGSEPASSDASRDE